MIVTMMPMVPKGIIRQISRRYIAGDMLQDAIDTTARLEQQEKGLVHHRRAGRVRAGPRPSR